MSTRSATSRRFRPALRQYRGGTDRRRRVPDGAALPGRASPRFTRARHNRTPMQKKRSSCSAYCRRRAAASPRSRPHRAQGLFKRWPIDYFDAPLPAARHVLAAAASGMRLAVHAHLSVQGFGATPRSSAWRSPCVARVLIQLHGRGFELSTTSAKHSSALVRTMLERAAGVLVPTELLKHWARATARHADVTCLPNPVAVEPLAKDPARRTSCCFSATWRPTRACSICSRRSPR